MSDITFPPLRDWFNRRPGAGEFPEHRQRYRTTSAINLAHRDLVEAEDRLLDLQVERLLALVKPTQDLPLAAALVSEIHGAQADVRTARAAYVQASQSEGR
jgi:hypothetical protein